MKKLQNILLIASAVFFTLFECRMFYLIHIEKAVFSFSLHYVCIIGATAFAWITLIIKLLTKGERKISDIIFNLKDGNLVRIAMLFTLAADYYLVLLEHTTENRLKGVSIFLGTQLFIFLHILVNDRSRKMRLAHLIIRTVLSVISVIIALTVLKDGADSLAIISIIYYANLVANLFFAPRSGRGGFILMLGLVLFALCDINVGLAVLNNMYDGGFPEGSLFYELLHFKYDLVWLFYIPSQTIIPLSLLFCDKKKA